MTSRQDRMQQMCSQYLDEDLKKNILFTQLLLERPYTYPFLGVIVTNDDLVYAMGSDGVDKFGLGPVTKIPRLTKMDSLCGKKICQFAVGMDSHHILALSDGGVVYAWGANKHGQLGINSRTNSTTPIVVAGDLSCEVVKQVGCGYNFSMALTEEGKVFTWGNNETNGRTGHGTTSGQTLSPKVVKGLLQEEVIVKISCCTTSVLCLTQQGQVFGFGSNADGYLGLGNSVYNESSPVLSQISAGRTIRDISCGEDHTLALTEDGILLACGYNICGQLGTGDSDNRDSPTQIEVGTDQKPKCNEVVRIFAEGSTSFAMDDEERVYVWGLVENEIVLRPTVFNITFPGSGNKCSRPSANCVVADLLEAFDDVETSDFIITVEGRDIHVHKSILQIRSLYFRTMFNNEWKETENGKVVIHQHPYKIYYSFLRYIYCGELSDLAPEESLRLMDLATMTLDDRLVKLCEKRVKKDLTPNNLIKVFSEALILNNDKLVNYCVMQVDLKAFKKVLASSPYQEVPDDHVREFVQMCQVRGVSDASTVSSPPPSSEPEATL